MKEDKKTTISKHTVMNVVATICRCVIAASLISVGVSSYLNSVNTSKIIISENTTAQIVHTADLVKATTTSAEMSIPVEIPAEDTAKPSATVPAQTTALAESAPQSSYSTSAFVTNNRDIATTAAQTAAEPSDGLININTADAQTLTLLPGIGDVKAAAIVAYREQYGNFRSIDEITEVSGIGEKTLEKLRPLITI